jgi:HD-GYP domain-containing protein (c-di-GMP phosphodiesterase class II)
MQTGETNIYNSRIIDTYIRLLRRKYPHVNIDKVLSYAMMEPYQVADESHWFSQEQVDLFYGAVFTETGNKDIAHEAGRFAASPDALGVMRKYALGFVGPARAYEMVGKYATNFTKSSVYHSEKIASNKVRITVTPNEGVREKPFQCENRIGFFEAIAAISGCGIPKIEHSACVFKGNDACQYVISWSETKSALVKRIRNYLGMFLFGAFSFAAARDINMAVSLVAPVSAGLLLSLSYFAATLENRRLNIAVNNLRESTEDLLASFNKSTEGALMINEIGMALSNRMDIDGILDEAVKILQKRLDYDRGLILLTNRDKSLLSYRAGFGYAGSDIEQMRRVTFRLNKEGSRGVFVVSFREQKPFLINDVNEIEDTLSQRSLDFARKMGVKSFICCPIIYEGRSIGILAVDNKNTKRPLLQSDINLLQGVTPGIGIAIHNAMVMEAKANQFKSIIKVLAASIDARDPLTAGHSEQVTEYALGICDELGLGKDYKEMIRVASLLHDYGKIGIQDSILKKPGKLTEEEHNEIKSHVVKTKRILQQIEFEGIYREIPEVVGSHHEKVDGSGYPRGREGDEIPLGARIIAVADFFEAITSKRHYRDPMPLDEAFANLRSLSGIHYDARVTQAFMNYFAKKYNVSIVGGVKEAYSRPALGGGGPSANN